jgi:hypothetical protein
MIDADTRPRPHPRRHQCGRTAAERCGDLVAAGVRPPTLVGAAADTAECLGCRVDVIVAAHAFDGTCSRIEVRVEPGHFDDAERLGALVNLMRVAGFEYLRDDGDPRWVVFFAEN